MRPIFIDIDPADANLIGFASNVTGATWTLTANDSGDSLAHQVSIRNDSATDHSGKTAALVGTDSDGKAQTETVTLPAGSATVESTKYFLTLTSVTPSATINADTMDIGWVDEVTSKTIPMDFYREQAASIGTTVTGTLDYTVEVTNDDVQSLVLPRADQASFNWLSDDNFPTGSTAALTEALSTWPVRAIRFRILSYTNGAELQANIVQAW